MLKVHTGPRRVLVVEDEYFLAQDLVEALGAQGLAVAGPVPSTQEANALLRSDPAIAAAVLDVKLGDQLVFPTAELLEELGIPFVFATGYDQQSLPERYSWVPRWEKPLDARALAARLRQLLQEPSGSPSPVPVAG